jgi:hypothetical protein
MRDATNIAGSPMPTHSACFETIENDDPDVEYAITLDADRTMTRPRVTNIAVVPRTR